MKRKLILVVTITIVTFAVTAWAATRFDAVPAATAQAPQPMSVPF